MYVQQFTKETHVSKSKSYNSDKSHCWNETKEKYCLPSEGNFPITQITPTDCQFRNDASLARFMYQYTGEKSTRKSSSSLVTFVERLIRMPLGVKKKKLNFFSKTNIFSASELSNFVYRQSGYVQELFLLRSVVPSFFFLFFILSCGSSQELLGFIKFFTESFELLKVDNRRRAFGNIIELSTALFVFTFTTLQLYLLCEMLQEFFFKNTIDWPLISKVYSIR